MPLLRRTRATLRSAEFGFFGVVVYTRVQTPRRWGEPFRAGVLFFDTLSWRPLRTSWLMVGTGWFPFMLTICAWHSAGHGGVAQCDRSCGARAERSRPTQPRAWPRRL